MTASRLAWIAWLWLCLILAPTAHAQGDPGTAPADLPVLRERLQLHEPMARGASALYAGDAIADAINGHAAARAMTSAERGRTGWGTLAVWAWTAGDSCRARNYDRPRERSERSNAVVMGFWCSSSHGGGWGARESGAAVDGGTAVSSVIGIAAIDAGIMAYKKRTVTPGSAELQLAPFAERATRTLGLSLAGKL